MAIMGSLDERMEESGFKAKSTLYDTWYQQWRALDTKLEKMPMMERADMLFDGKVNINDITDELLEEIVDAVVEQVAMHKKMIEENDIDADPEDLEIWEKRLAELGKL